MTKRNETDDDKQTYLGVGIVFITVGIAFLLNDSMRTIGVVFAILGVTFLTLGQGGKTKKKKRSTTHPNEKQH